MNLKKRLATVLWLGLTLAASAIAALEAFYGARPPGFKAEQEGRYTCRWFGSYRRY